MTIVRSSVLIAGAGPTGLVAGWRLAQQGHTVAIADRRPKPGGMSASFAIAGQRVDFGSHRLHGRADPELLALLAELLGEDLQRRPRNGRIRLEGRWVGFPLRATDLVRRLPPRFAFRAALDSVTGPLRRSDRQSFESAVRAGLGPTVFDAFYRPYAKKLWGVDASEIDASMADRRVSAGSPVDILKRLLAARNPERRDFFYPKHGYGQIAEAFAKAATDAGADLRLGTTIERIQLDPDGAAVSMTSDGHTTEEQFDLVVSTVPAPLLVGMVTPEAPAPVIAAADSLETRGMVFAYLVVPREQYTHFDAHYFPALDTVMSRLSEPKNYRTGPDPEGQTVLCAEIPCTVGDELWKAGGDELGARLSRELVAMGLPEPQQTATVIRRLKSVYPVYRTGFADQLATVEQWAESHDRLLMVGRQGLFVPDNLHHVVAMGESASSVVGPDGSIDRTAWRHYRESFRSHVVED